MIVRNRYFTYDIALCETDFEIQYSQTNASGWKMVCRIFGLVTIQTSIWRVFCTNNELLASELMDCSHFCSTCTFYPSFLHFFFISYPTVFLLFVLFCVVLFYLLSRSVYFTSFYLFFLFHSSHFLLTYFLVLLMCFPVSSFYISLI